MPGVKTLRKIQLGKETVAGTPVAATTIWRGLGTIKDQRERTFVEEDVGILGGTDRSYVSRTWGELAMPAVEATYEQLPYILEAGIKAATPSQDGTGSGYIYQYTAPTTSQNTHRTYTIEGGDDNQAEEFDYCFVSQFTLAGQGQEALKMSANWMGRAVVNSTFTGALSIPTVEEILVNNAKIYIDDSGGTIGTTQVSNTLLGLELNYTTGLIAYYAVDGSLEFNRTKFTADEIVLTLTYEHDSSAVTEKGKWRTGDTRLIRLLFEGSDFAVAGATYTKKTMIMDFAGKYDDWSELDEVDGNDIVRATFRCRYSVADTLKADITVVNALSALT